MATVTVNGVTYTDDDNATTGLANGGHRTRLVPMFGNAVTDLLAKKDAAAASAATATSQASTSTTKAAESAASAAAAVVSQNAASASAASAAAIAGAFVGTSVTSLLIAIGSKTFTTQTGEQYTAGVFLSAVSAANNANFMMGQVTSYNTSTGALVLDVQVIGGSGTLADWNISLVGARGATGATGATGTGITAQAVGFTATAGTTPKTLTTDDDLTTSQAARRNAANVYTGQQTFAEVKDTVATITDGAAFEIDPLNGSVQIVTLGANRTPAATNFEAGQTVILGIDDGTAYAVTWTTVNPTWVKAGGTGAAPTLATTGYTWILLWKVGAVMYAAEVGKP